jgi:CRP-like cAMP-binding protein
MEEVVSEPSSVDILIAALERLHPLEQRDRSEIHALRLRPKTFSPNEEIVQEGTAPNESCFVVSGFAARAQHLADGGRQLDQIHIVGDFVDLHSLHLQTMDHSVVAIGECRVAYIPHGDLVAAMRNSPKLKWLLWQLTVLDGAVARTWMACIGRRKANAALAHLVCELFTRLGRIGATANGRFTFPARQTDVADMLGMTTVHVSRTLADLRLRQLLEWSHHEVRVLNFEKLAEIADFSASYLEPGRPIPGQF